MITIIGAEWCDPCQAAKKLLDRSGIKYNFINVDKTPNGWDIVEAISGKRAIPCIFYKFRSPREFHLALKEAGVEAFQGVTTQPIGKKENVGA